ncbi:uncharacterized protein LOC142350417 [Convolutriloba macropyga]|uniref:uncharacterized protein LOC142350417 n=1 Tax=Convolutriloba macropyga TaxID=536237 RepID=UPI003F520430
MSLRTRINCYTAWVNFRLLEYDVNLNNVISDILQGSNLKLLVNSMVGYPPKRLASLDDLTQNQVITRVEWAVKELKSINVIPAKSEIDGRLFAMRSSDQIFNLLGLLVQHDIQFLWDRQEFLRLRDNNKLCEVPLKWVPDQVPTRTLKANPTTQIDEDDAMLMGFGNTVAAQHSVEYEPIPEDFERYSGQQICLNYKPVQKRMKKRLSPEKAMLEILQGQFNCTEEGKALGRIVRDRSRHSIKSLRDMTNSQAFCALINTFIPDTFSNEILLRDRWAFNLALKTFEKMTHLQSPVTAEDLSNYDNQCFCAYLCTFFMLMYKFKQCQSVVRRLGEVKMMIRRAELEIGKNPAPTVDEYGLPIKTPTSQPQNEAKSHWAHVLKSCQDELESLGKLYDVSWCENWVKHVGEVQNQTRQIIRNKMKDRFDVIIVPQNMSVSELVTSLNLNLSITKCHGFAQLYSKELVAVDKKIVVRNHKTGEFLDDFSGSSKDDFSIRKFLGYNSGIMVEINPEKHPKYDIFVEVPTLSKMLRAGSEYLYMVFPGGMGLYENMLQKAVKNGEFEMVRKFVVFFNSNSYVNSRDPNTGSDRLSISPIMLFHFGERLVKVESLERSFIETPTAEIKPCIIIHYTDYERGCEGSTRVTMGMMHWEFFLALIDIEEHFPVNLGALQ